MNDHIDDIGNKKEFILDKLHQAYEREIATLWQRSVFLWAFLFAISTGYGTILTKAIELQCICRYTYQGIQSSLVIISFLGVIFSMLWVFMARASKANQEICEMRIIAISKKFGISADKCCENINEKSFIDETGVSPYILGHVTPRVFRKYVGWANEFDSKFFSMSGGKFSVSKINIIIGYIFCIFYTLIFAINASSLLFSFMADEKNTKKSYFCYLGSDFSGVSCYVKIIIILTIIILTIFLIFLLSYCLRRKVKSGYIR